MLRRAIFSARMGTRHVGMRPQMMRSLQHTRPFHLSQSRWNDKAEEAKEGEADKAEEKAEAKEEKKEEKKEKTPEEIIKEKDAEIADMKNKYMTSLAEMQNLRTRTQKDVSSAKKYGGQEFAKSILDVADNITMALNATKADATDENPKLKSFYEGVEMTQAVLLKALEKNSVTRMKSLGEKFDPNFHDGMFQYDDPEQEPGTIGQVVKDGYMISDRVLRPAQVGTIKARAKTE